VGITALGCASIGSYTMTLLVQKTLTNLDERSMLEHQLMRFRFLPVATSACILTLLKIDTVNILFDKQYS
jgi:hypothetical protein